MRSGKNKESVRKFLDSNPYLTWGLLTAVTVLFTLILSPTLVITEHSYQVGDVAERDIKAPKDFLVEDEEATEAHRKQAAENILTVYDHDEALLTKLTQSVSAAQAAVAEARRRHT